MKYLGNFGKAFSLLNSLDLHLLRELHVYAQIQRLAILLLFGVPWHFPNWNVRTSALVNQ